MEKRALVILSVSLLFVVILSGVIARAAENDSVNATVTATQGDTGDNIDRAYQCLTNLVAGNTKLSLQEAVFASLALGYKKESSDEIESEKGANCWPKAGCKIKETAQSMLAYNAMGKSTADIAKWLLSKNGTVTDLQWYLQIDITNHGAASCDISYDGSYQGTLNVNNDMTLSGGIGSCLTLSGSNYWLRISNNCINKEFEITCNQDFVTNLLYQKGDGQTVYVSSNTNSKPSSGTTKERISASCFKNANVCDYEGTLWAAYALSRSGNSVSDFIPYLVALADDNRKYFPSAFIFIVAGAQDQYSDIVQSQKQSRYWEMTATPNNKFFDTALGMLALKSTSALERENAKEYLLGIQTSKGCWNNDNIRDTGFLLYSGWARETGGGGGGGTDLILCTQASSQYSCASSSACVDSGGRVLFDFQCPGVTDYCCNIKPEIKHCTNGRICEAGYRCTLPETNTLEGSCCEGTCELTESPNTCEGESIGICKVLCDSNTEDEIASASCGDSQRACCIEKEKESSSLWIWIIILIVLIALVALAIVYRDRLRFWWFQFRGRSKSSPITKSGSGYGPFGAAPPRAGTGISGFWRPAARQIQPSRPAPKTARDREMEETFKKLREMGR